MKILTLIVLTFMLSCNTPRQLERSVAKIERIKKALGIKPCDCITVEKSLPLNNGGGWGGDPGFYQPYPSIKDMPYLPNPNLPITIDSTNAFRLFIIGDTLSRLMVDTTLFHPSQSGIIHSTSPFYYNL